jgi:hypothetical protein
MRAKDSTHSLTADFAAPLHYATYFDRHYVTRGLALYRSLLHYSPQFILWVLCLDEEAEQILTDLGLAELRLIPLRELEAADPALPATRPTRSTAEYYWTCGPAFLLYLLQREVQIELLTYLDSDLFFFDDPRAVLRELKSGSILLIEHGFSTPKGKYNVGMIAFRRTKAVLACLERWREQCLEWCYFRLEGQRYGDQGYLNEWPQEYPGVVVAQHKGAGVARWNDHQVRYERGRLLAGPDPVIFYHFSGIRRFWRWLYFGGRRVQGPISAPVRRHIYLPYFRELRALEAELGRVIGSVPPFGSGLHSLGGLGLLCEALWKGGLVPVFSEQLRMPSQYELGRTPVRNLD